MSDEENATYLAGRAATERRMAEQSTDLSARDAHRQLAKFYAVRASRQNGYALLDEPQARSG